MPMNFAPSVLIVKLISIFAVARSIVGVLFVAGVVNAIAADGDSCAKYLFLLGVYVAADASVGGSFM